VQAYREPAETPLVKRRRRHPTLDISSLAAGIALGMEIDAVLLLGTVATRARSGVPEGCELSACLAVGALFTSVIARALARRARLETSLAPERFQPQCARAARRVARVSDVVAASTFVVALLAFVGSVAR
jgi:hypothetical protein